ncbi:ClpP family protease [Desulfitobacterium metallireducens]|uniref:Translocation-enhancing protein TepA n=1 Tax=Desulfitobacterium metallireducens DSM 15288 TaxID=871968 RepID=W0E6W9_9FIRM|nr:ATP-dependent Clp protease proteolytic subunit [Desulfitobacterium metallireducens]AHF06635.1 translocation-enhancing protein TepA [Desulfitobacterium metallireducens DSM 15288]
MLKNNEGFEEESKNPEVQNLKELGQIRIPEPAENIYCLTVVGQIEGHQILPAQSKATKYEHVIPQLVAVEQNPKIEGILLILNTAGGDVEAGLAISELVSSLSKPSVSLVLGGGHSIGIPIAVSCSKSFISPTGTMTVHPIRYTGLVINGHQQFEYLQKMQERINSFIVQHSKVSEEDLKKLMFATGELAQDIGTILIGQDAVDVGLIDAVGGLKEAYAEMKRLIEVQKTN